MSRPLPAEAGDIRASLQAMGLAKADEWPNGEPLAGGVSSDIWRIDLAQGPVCAKRALAKLKVAADWQAPVERSHYEAAWLALVGRWLPGAAPELLGEDRARGVVVMAWMDPATHPLWKAELLAGRVDIAFAGEVGGTLGRIHRRSATDPRLARAFPTGAIFEDIRLAPYLRATADAHGDLADALHALADRTAATTRALVHGDVSPKNILMGPQGPVFLDAECATWGDPAFDLAFCLNHLLLKAVCVPGARAALADAFEALASGYLANVDWEEARDLEARAASLLPGLLLARVDGKSPVEYLRDPRDLDRIRSVARPLLSTSPARLAAVRDALYRTF